LEPTLNFFAVINTLGALQCTLTAFALFSIKTGNRTANRFLGLFLIALAVLIFDFVMYDTRFFLSVPQLYPILDPVVLVVTPLFFFYIKSLTNQRFSFRKRDLLHFLLFFLFFLLLLPDFFRGPEAKLQDYMDELKSTGLTIDYYIGNAIIDTQILAYLFASFIVLSKAIKNQPGLGKNTPINVKWLRNLIVALTFVSVMSAIFDFMPIARESGYNNYITPFLLTLIIYSMGYLGIRQSEIFTTERLFSLGKKYQKSVLTDEMAEKILKKLTHLMQEEKLYRDSMISLPAMAVRLKITTHHLSQILNERLDRNFFNYISEYRVEEAKQRLLEPDASQITMLELAYDIGFNSLSAFNTAFKKHSGMSPSEFKKQNDQR